MLKNKLIILSLITLIIAGMLNINFLINSNKITSQAQGVTTSVTSNKLLDYAKANEIKFGTAILNEHLDEADYVNTAVTEFDSFTSEYEMKPNHWWVGVNNYDFVEGDKLANLAKSKGIKMRGHTLIWYLRPPDWLPNSNFTTQEYRNFLRKGVYDYVKHYEDKYPKMFYAWDVVNEQIQDATGEMRVNNFWYNKLGDEMFSIAFQAARDASPNAKLVINDYYIEVPGAKTDALIALVSRLKQAGVPIDGVGFQSHFRIGNEPNYPLFIDVINRFKATGVQVEFTEVDMRGGDQNDKAVRTYNTVKACLITKCKSITFWGITDKYSWLEGENGLLFDGSYNRKSMYTQAIQAFKDFGVTPGALKLKLNLQGAYNTSTNIMRTDFKNKNFISNDDPYDENALFNPSPTSIVSAVDWVKIIVENTQDPSLSLVDAGGLLLSDGNIIMDPLIAGATTNTRTLQPGKYKVTIKHRNHLAITTNTDIGIVEGQTTTLDFTTNQNVKGGNQAMLKPGVYGLKMGNTDGNGQINSLDRIALRLSPDRTNVMSLLDINMDGNISAIDRILSRSVSDSVEQL